MRASPKTNCGTQDSSPHSPGSRKNILRLVRGLAAQLVLRRVCRTPLRFGNTDLDFSQAHTGYDNTANQTVVNGRLRIRV